MFDPDKIFQVDFNYSHEYFDNDHPNQWVNYTNPTNVVDNVYYPSTRFAITYKKL